MCVFPSAPKDNSAAIARQAEEARQARIREGTERVNQTFAGFDDDFFSGVQKASDEFFLPQVQDQYEKARRDLVLSLGSAGTLNGSVGAGRLGELDQSFQLQRGSFANQGVAAANQTRADVERNRSEVLSQLSASADPSAAAQSAAARAQSLTAPPAFSPIGKLFTDFAQTGALGLAAKRAGFRGFDTGLFQPVSGPAGSSRIIS